MMKMLIGGELVDSSNHGTRDLVNPANMEVIDQVPMASKNERKWLSRRRKICFRGYESA